MFGPGGLHTARGNFIELMPRRPQTVRVRCLARLRPALAERTVEMARAGLSGVYHVGGGTPISWYEYARLIFFTAGLAPELRATDEREYRTAARRPRFSALSNAKMERAGITPMPPLPDAIRQYLAARGNS